MLGRQSLRPILGSLGDPRLAGFIPTTYQLCFRRVGEGPFTITFHDFKLDTAYASERGYRVSNYDEQAELVSTDGKNVVSLHSIARLDEGLKVLGFIPGPTVRIAKMMRVACSKQATN